MILVSLEMSSAIISTPSVMKLTLDINHLLCAIIFWSGFLDDL